MVIIKTIQQIVEDLDMTLRSEYYNQKWALVEEQQKELNDCFETYIVMGFDITTLNAFKKRLEINLFGE